MAMPSSRSWRSDTVQRGSQSGVESAETDRLLRRILADVLSLAPGRSESFTHDSGLFGVLPELDSLAVASVLTEMEDRLGIHIDDEDVDGELFETYGSLLAFAQANRPAD